MDSPKINIIIIISWTTFVVSSPALSAYLLVGARNRESIAKWFCIQCCCCCCFCFSGHPLAKAFGSTTTFEPIEEASTTTQAVESMILELFPVWLLLLPLNLIPNFIWYRRLFTTLIIWNRAITAAKLYQKNTGSGYVQVVQRCVVVGGPSVCIWGGYRERITLVKKKKGGHNLKLYRYMGT